MPAWRNRAGASAVSRVSPTGRESAPTPARTGLSVPMNSLESRSRKATESGEAQHDKHTKRREFERPGDEWLRQAALGDPMVTFDSDGRAYITNAERAEQFDRDEGGER